MKNYLTNLFKYIYIYILLLLLTYVCVCIDACMQHRYYGKSVPFNSFEEDFNSTNTLGYFDSAQALADYAELILHIKQAYNATDSPVIVLGGSYGGST